MPSSAASARLWQNLLVRLAVALAFADASIVVLALPQIVDRLHTSISHVTWVIMAYNLALIVGCAIVLPFAARLASSAALVGGLALFGLASVGCGISNHLWSELVPLRAVQGLGGALVLCASLPTFATAARPGDSPLYGWSAAAAVGAAIGPAAGGVLTQLFDWRSIFLFQAPVAAFAAVAVLAARPGARDVVEEEPRVRGRTLHPLSANVGLTLFSAGLIGALFLVVIELINAWLLSPIAAAAIVTTIPVFTALVERLVRGNSPLALGAGGALLLALGLVLLSLANRRDIALVVIALALCGSGLGLAFPGLTTAALETPGHAAARAAKTVAARDAGIVIGLLVLTPIFVSRINSVSHDAIGRATGDVLLAPIPLQTKEELGLRLAAAVAKAPQSAPPKIHAPFAQVREHVPASERPALTALESKLSSLIANSVTPPFKVPLRYGALFAIAVLPVLAFLEWLLAYRRRRRGTPEALSAG